ncbi:MAG: crosslink repair DNA glycosylase YcaQ family protein [Acidimicrobiia bacterium]
MRSISLARARRIALAAQGFAEPRPSGRLDVRHFRRVLDRVGLVQLDSVNVLARAHYLPFFSRLGSYPREALDAWLWGSGELFEYWGHEASLIPVAHHHLFRHRMDGGWHWEGIERLGREHPDYVAAVLEDVRTLGPVTPRDVDDAPPPPGTWWEWGKAKLALEWLFLTGKVTTADRVNFQRRYDLPERVLPAGVLDRPDPGRDEARRSLLLMAARASGIGTAEDLADYYRLKTRDARPLLSGLVRDGRLEEVEVPGWRGSAYLHPEARVPRRVEGRAFLCPFDPVVWFRPRVERLFGFHYRIEIYVPEPKRRHGYYVLPFLLDGELVARVDLKADRAARRLVARAAFAEEGVDRSRVAAELAGELAVMASWLGLDSVEVGDRGDLGKEIRRTQGW